MGMYLLVLEVDEIDVHQPHESLPLHCTALPWFKTTASPDDLQSLVKPIFKQHGPIRLVGYKRGWFGPQGDIPACVIRMSRELRSLHFSLLLAANTLPVEHVFPRYIGSKFRPHVSDRGDRQFGFASTHLSRNAYLIEADDPAPGAIRSVVEKIALNS